MRRPLWLQSLTQQGTTPPYLLKYRSSEAFIVATIALAIFTDMILYALIVPVVPFSLSSRAHVAPDRVQYWVAVLIAIYAAALLFWSPICGWIADHSASRRSPLLVGLFALLGATVLLHVGNGIGVMIAGRVLQGSSAAVVWVVGLALLADTVPQERLAQAMGYVGAGMSVGILLGPLLGGIVFDRAGYGAVFGIAYALIGLDVVLRLLLVEKKVAARWNPEAGGRASAWNEQGKPGQESGEAVQDPSNGSGKQEPVASSSTDPEQGRPRSVEDAAPENSIPKKRKLRGRLPPLLSLLYSRRLDTALFGAIMQASVMSAFDSVLTIHVADTFHWSSTGAALLFLPIVIPSFLGPVFGWLSDRYGGRYLATLGFLCALPPLICLRYIDTNKINDKVLICILLVFIGLSLTATFPSIMAEISAVVEVKEKKMLASGMRGYGSGGAYAQAYALFNMAFAAGCTLGPLLAGFLVEQEGWATMAWILGLLLAVAAVPTFFWLGGFLFVKQPLECH
ncbi:MFS transporter-like protein [Bimuria novae-zelandiae CBS 107.79]|uniref:MFS transporter-like protein n=1 Tax=Bimuria novae-zelandiae CBS 107.79 TaxID=1447943 RepID=A0A6A5VGK9_9PLEO|nr:MFS transporter-like protein [Bimuria novae-zelandiae CBS 107.79]